MIVCIVCSELLIKLRAINIGIREHIVYFVDIYILQP